MATFPDHYIPSRKPGRTLRVHYSKPWRGSPASITAHLGTLEDGLFIPCEQLSCIRLATGGRATKGKIGDAARALLEHMANERYITNDHAYEFTSRILHSIR